MKERVENRDKSKIGKIYFDLDKLRPVKIVGADINDLLIIKNGQNGNVGSGYWVLTFGLIDRFSGIDITGLTARKALSKIKQFCHPEIIPHLPSESYFRECLKRATDV